MSKFNSLTKSQLKDQLYLCCGSQRWVEMMSEKAPYGSTQDTLSLASKIWFSLNESDWLEAFSKHPPIGIDKLSLNQDFKTHAALSEREQKSASNMNHDTRLQLKTLNEEYYKIHGFVFLIFASGKSGDFILDALKKRISHSRTQELEIASKEQNLIMLKRLESLA